MLEENKLHTVVFITIEEDQVMAKLLCLKAVFGHSHTVQNKGILSNNSLEAELRLASSAASLDCASVLT